MLKIKVLLNSVKISTSNSFKKGLEHFALRGINIEKPVVFETKLSGLKNERVIAADKSYRQLITNVPKVIKDYVDPSFDITIFVFDGDVFDKKDMPTSNAYHENGMSFVNLLSYKKGGSKEFYSHLIHELKHAIKNWLIVKYSIVVPDPMDVWVRDGKAEFYYNNDKPELEDSNHGEWFRQMKPYYHLINNEIIMADLSKFKLVPALEQKAQLFLQKCAEKGYNLRITQGLRTNAEQAVLYAKGRTTKGPIVTNAKPGESLHNKGKAFDVCFTGATPYPSDEKKWKAIADIGVSVGLTAGYYFKSFKDMPHFEIK